MGCWVPNVVTISSTRGLGYTVVMRITLPLVCFIAARSLTAQTRPDGAQRVWLELQLGGSSMSPNCAGCAQQSRFGGPSATAALGATITPRFGVAVLYREFDEFSFDYSHSGHYTVAFGQYLLNPDQLVGVTINGGLGYGTQHGDEPPYGDNGGGPVLAGGLGFRLPTASTFAFTLNFDLMKTLSGNLRTPAGHGSTYQPLLFTIGLGLNIAGSSQK